LIVLNDIFDTAQGIDSDDRAIVIFSATDETRVECAPKSQVTATILVRVVALTIRVSQDLRPRDRDERQIGC
jgi:hypothetical protein